MTNNAQTKMDANTDAIAALAARPRKPRMAEQLTAAKELSAAALGYRVIADAEGWAVSPGKYGLLEHLGAGQLAAFTERRLIRSKLLAVPGATRHQVGDTELRVLLSPQAVPAVATLLRCHRKRTGGVEHLAGHAYRRSPSAVEASA
jgi:hypothetical protein